MKPDLNKRQFIWDAFDIVARRFEEALDELAMDNEGIAYDFARASPTKFTAEIFVDGQSRARCKIWIGTMLGGNEIGYSESDVIGTSDNSYNELLSVTDGQGELALSASMGMMAGPEAVGLKQNSLTAEAGADYLWRRFVMRLG